MMNLFDYPDTSGKTEEEKFAKINNYLFRLKDELEMNFGKLMDENEMLRRQVKNLEQKLNG